MERGCASIMSRKYISAMLGNERHVEVTGIEGYILIFEELHLERL